MTTEPEQHLPDFSNVSFKAEINRIAVEIGASPSAEYIETLQDACRSRAFVDEVGAVKIQTREGALDADGFIGRAIRALAAASPPVAPATKGVTENFAPRWTRERVGLVPELGRAWAQANAERALADALAGPNPWTRGKENRTRQQVIRNTNPALAAEMQAKARIT